MDHHEPSAGSQLTRRSFLAAATPVLVTAGSALAQLRASAHRDHADRSIVITRIGRS